MDSPARTDKLSLTPVPRPPECAAVWGIGPCLRSRSGHVRPRVGYLTIGWQAGIAFSDVANACEQMHRPHEVLGNEHN